MIAGYRGFPGTLCPSTKKQRINEGDCKKIAPACTEAVSFICNDLDGWLSPESLFYKALLVQRPRSAEKFQKHVDNLAEAVLRSAAWEAGSVQEHIELSPGLSKEKLALDLVEAGHRVATIALEHGVPEDLASLIEDDFQQIGMVVAEMAPSATKMSLKLDVMGENICARWHRDHYQGRAVVSYNSCGTQYVADEYVNHQRLDKGDKTDLIRDESQIISCAVGDVLFMKGVRFPGALNGLIHRSPPKRYHESGQVMNRLLLKVDVN